MSENMNGVSAGNAANKTYVNTKYKDTFFRYLFKEKAGMLELYNALFDDCLTDESEIEDCTIDNKCRIQGTPDRTGCTGVCGILQWRP